MKRKAGLPLLLCLAAMTAGCVYVPQGDRVDVTFYGSLDRSAAGFSMEGYIAAEGGVPDAETYGDVSVRLHSADGSTLCSAPVGDLGANHGRVNVTVSTDLRPVYVVVDSDDFWSEEVSVDYFVLDDGTYVRQEAVSRDDYPIALSRGSASAC